MATNEQDVLARAYARLSALRKNIGQMEGYQVLEIYVDEYHSALERLQAVGIDVSEFRIPDSEVEPRTTASWFEGDVSKHSYSEEKYVDKPFILTKLDAILGYFEIITSEKPRKIGFTKYLTE